MDWHARFLQQAGWTHDLRVYLFGLAKISEARTVLEVGCGTGALLAEEFVFNGSVHGLDIDHFRLAEARGNAPIAQLTQGDALHLPYSNATFDISFCHYLLLWVKDPLNAIAEMKRVTRPGGAVLALAEPDYDSRVDKPEYLASLGRWQTESLYLQGADPGIGARLADLFAEAGIRLIETGLIQANSQQMQYPMSDRELEWAVMEADLGKVATKEEIQRMKSLEEQAWQAGTRSMHVPTYFAYGMV